MKRLLAYLFLVLGFVLFNYNVAMSQSSLPECEGNNKNISKYSRKHFDKMKKWTNCHGTAMGPKGQKYIGEFYKGKFHGQGIFRNEGREYVGQYKNHKRHGQGTYTYANGEKYVGGWKKHKYYGKGTYTYSNGDKYIGKWKKDKYFEPAKRSEQHGQGTLTKADGTIENGIWKKGKLVKRNNIEIQVDKKAGGGLLAEQEPIYCKAKVVSHMNTYISKNGEPCGSGYIQVTEKIFYNTPGRVYLDPDYEKEQIAKKIELIKREIEELGVTPIIEDKFLTKDKYLAALIKQFQKIKEPPINPDKDVDTDPPVIQIAEAITVVSQSYTIKGTVRDKSKPIYLEINGRPVEVKKGKFELERFNIDPDVVEELKIVAIDPWNNRSEKIVKVTVELQSTEVVRTYEELKPNRVKVKADKDKIAIIIGIEKYEKLNNLDAKFANRDAKAFRAYATQALGVKPSNIKILVDEKADRGNTLEAFKIWLPKIANNDGKEIYVFFAGHGLASENGEDLYILPQDGNAKMLDDTAITRVKLISLIQKVNPKSVTMFFDTCYSGQTRGEQMLVASLLRPIRIVAEEQDTPDNFTIFSASNFDQASGGIEEAKHGMFSYYLMKGLEGKADVDKNKKITNGEMIAYLKTNVSKEAFTQNREQDPMLSGDPDQILMRY
jgi:hypothetical protein